MSRKIQQIISNFQTNLVFSQGSSLESSLGFSNFGWVKLEKSLNFESYQNWIKQGLHGEMNYLKSHLEAKENPKSHWPQFCSVLMFSFPYFSELEKDDFFFKKARVSLYAQGGDYHFWIKEKLQIICAELIKLFPSHVFLSATDAFPLMERDFAYQAGMGWIGKNTCLIHPKEGSLFFLGEILTSLPLEEIAGEDAIQSKIPDFCGKCTLCLEACPTKALVEPRKVDARRCISYLTIESRSIPDENLREAIGDWLFGCDICQTVCPWNQKIHKMKFEKMKLETERKRNLDFEAREILIQELRFLLNASGKQIQKKLRGTPLLRSGQIGLKRNAILVAVNQNLVELIPDIQQLESHEKLSELAVWALKKLTF